MGRAAAILFIAVLPDVAAFKSNRAGDAELYDLLTEANHVGVDIKAVAIFYSPGDSSIYRYHQDLPVKF